MKLRSKELQVTLVAALLFIFLLIGIPASVPAQEDLVPPQQRSRRVNDALQQSPSAIPSEPLSKKNDSSAQDDEMVRIETNLVDVLFNALDKNYRFITTLRQEDIRVLENGAPQEISVFQRETDLPLSLAILIDASKSQERTLPDEKDAALAFVESVIRPEKDKVAVISFTGEATVEQELTDNVAKLRNAIKRVEIVLPPEPAQISFSGNNPSPATTVDPDSPIGWTSIWDAVWLTSNEVLAQTSDRTRRAIILLTDGDDTRSRMKRQDAIDAAIKANTVIYAIGIGDSEEYKFDKGALRKISESTGGRAFFPANEAELSASFAQIQQELRSQYLVAYSPINKARDGSYRQVRIEVVNPELRKQKLKLTYRQGYYALATAHAPGKANVSPDGEVRHLRVPRNKKQASN